MAAPLPEFPLDVPVPKNMQAALRSLVDRGFLGSRRYQEQQWRAVRVGAHTDIREFADQLVKVAEKAGIPLFAHNMVRTNEQQAQLLADGVSRSGPGKSPHNFGCAVDIIHSVKAWNLKANQWALIGHLGKEVARKRGLKLTWGGDWSDPDGDGIGWDPAHWELSFWKSVLDDFPWYAHDYLSSRVPYEGKRALLPEWQRKLYDGE